MKRDGKEGKMSSRTLGGESAVAQYRSVRQATMALCRPLAVEDHVPQSMTTTSPAKWHLAHTSWFFEEFILQHHLPGYDHFHPRYSYLFNSYYDAVGDRVARPERGVMTRPTLDDVHRYREHVDQRMLELLSGPALDADQRLYFLFALGLNHEQQHQELILTDIKHLLSLNPLKPAYDSEAAEGTAGSDPGPVGWHIFDEDLREIGFKGDGFAFDNESPRHRRFVGAFALANRLVTCGEYLEFMADGGYRRPELWLDEGWAAVRSRGWQAPLYWAADGTHWQLFTLQGMRPVAAAEPVSHVSFYEAEAYARWAGARLPGEAEWETACGPLPCQGNFVESGRRHPATCGPGGDSPIRQAFGDLWEWTQSPYRPYPGFRPAEGAVGEYNGKFMCSQFVLRGGSCATPANHIRPTYRNFFHPDARWQFSGIRLARDEG
jgi:ergothioneine biosynthesis protein EgtB